MGRKFRKSIRTGGFLTTSSRTRTRPSMPEVDLHGLRSHIGENRLASFMQERIQNGDRTVKIVHGHGTGVMREIVYAWIDNHRHIVADTHDLGPAVIVFLR